MNKIQKIGVTTFALTMGGILTLANPGISSVFASTGISSEDQIKIENFVSEFKGNENVVVPYGTDTVSSADVVPTITALNGKYTVSEDLDTTDKAVSFKAAYSSYTATYTLSNGVKKSLNITVDAINAKLSFESNNSVFLPSSCTTNTAITIPYPVITDTSGDKLLNASGEELTDRELVSSVKVEVQAPNNTWLSSTETDDGGVLKDSTKVYLPESGSDSAIYYKEFTPKSYGTYTIYYSYLSNGVCIAKTSKTVSIDRNYQSKATLSFTYKTTMPTSAILGQATTLPLVTAVDKTNGSVEVPCYAEITVCHINDDGTLGSALELDDNNAFTPMEKGNYSISYKVRDFFGNYADTDTRVIYNVKDTVAPTVKVVEPYTVDGVDTTTDDFKDARKDASYLIPSIAGLNGIYSLNTASTEGVVFPAIYAEDNYSKLENLTFQRSVIRKTNGNTEIIDSGKNYYENVTWKFTYADTYTVQYKVKDEAENTRIATYEIKIVDTGVDNLFGANGDEPNGDKTAPTISFTGVLPTSTKAGDTISFTKPTAIDYIKDSTSISDTRLNVVTYYFAGNTIPMNSGKVDYSKLTVVNEDEDNTNNLSFVVPKTITDSYVSVYTEVSDDYGNLASVTKSIKLLSVTDTVAPVTTSGTSIESELKQGGTITLPDIVVSDANASALVVNVEIKDKNNNSISWQGLNTTYASDKITLSGINFVAIQSGDYTISVVAKDLGNNYSVYGYKFTVAKTTKPNIELGQYSVTAELGDEINISDFKVMDEGTEVDKTDASLTYNVAISGGRYSPISNDTFIPLEAGTYTITYTASVSGISAESKAYTVTVKDTKSPVITIVGSEPTLQYDLDTESPKPITIPHFEATDAKGTAYDSLMDNTVTTKVTVVSNVSGASSDPLALTETTDGYQFTPSTKSGKYTVTYSATDAAGNTATKTFTLSVGDVVAPVINLNKNASDETSNEPGDKKINETLTLDLNNIAIDDNDDGPISALKADGKLIIKLVGPDNKSVENTSSDGYSYKLTQAGTYTLTYKVTDEAGNTATATRTFTVTADTIAQGIDSETGKVIGIVLSLAVLAGVIVYFLVSSKKDKKNAPKEKKEDKKASK